MGVIDNAVQWATDIANDDSHWYSQDVSCLLYTSDAADEMETAL